MNMNGKKARAFRKMVYGDALSPRNREYSIANAEIYKYEIKKEDHKSGWIKRGFEIVKEGVKEFVLFKSGQIVTDLKRQRYQRLKKQYIRGF